MVVLNTLRNLVLIPVYLKYIDQSTLGAWMAFVGANSFLGLSDFGLNSLMTQKIAFLFGKSDYKSIKQVAYSGFFSVLAISAVILFLAQFFIGYLPHWLVVYGVDTYRMEPAFRLAALETFVVVLTNGMAGVLMGLQRPMVHITGMIAAQIITISMIISLLQFDYGILSIPLGAIVGTFVWFIGNAVGLQRVAAETFPKSVSGLDVHVTKDLLRNSYLIFITKLCNLISNKSYSLVVALILAPSMVVIIEINRKAALLAQDITNRISGSVMPGLAHVWGREGRDKFIDISRVLLRITTYLAIWGASAFLLFNQGFIKLWVGNEYFAGFILTSLISGYTLVALINAAAYTISFAQGNVRAITSAAVVESVLQILLSIGLGFLWGLNGIAAAWLAASAVGLLVQASSIRGIGRIIAFKNIEAITALQYLISASAPGAVTLLLTHWIKPDNWISFFGLAAVYCLTAIIIIVLRFKELRRPLIDAIQNTRSVLFY